MSLAAQARTLADRLTGIVRHRPERRAVSEWDRAYSSGQLAYFGDLDEFARYSVLTGYVRYIGGRPDIIDIGCGDGLLRSHLEGLPFASYLGIDLSGVAVAAAQGLIDASTTFICTDVMTSKVPDADVVVL